MITNKYWEKDGYVLRSIRKEDAEAYYEQNFKQLDKEIVRFTGCKESFEKEEVISFVNKSVDDEDRYMFFMISPDGRIVGESVINEINERCKSAGFRIAIFQSTEREKGLGSWMVQKTRDFAFEDLGLHRLELEVYSFNPRAKRVYEKAGFKVEGICRDAILDGEKYADVILMAMLEDEYKAIKQ